MYYIIEFFIEYKFLYIFMYLYIKNIFLFLKDKFKNLKKKKFKDFKKNKKNWVDIWNIDTEISKLENIEHSPWNLYFKYKLSMITSWHILEERFLIFFIIFLFCFF